MRRKSLIDEEQSVEHSAEVAAEQQKRLKCAATGGDPPSRASFGWGSLTQTRGDFFAGQSRQS